MKGKILLMLLSGIMMLASCSSSDEPGGSQYPRHEIALNADQQVQRDNLNRMAAVVWNEIQTTETTPNIIYSPISLFQCLSMTSNGTGGATLNAFKEFLMGSQECSLQELNDFNRYLLSELPKVDPSVKLYFANMVCSPESVHPLDAFVSTLKDVYQAEYFNYPTALEGMSLVNNWISDKTNGKIPDFLSGPEDLDILDLFNTAYFDGSWSSSEVGNKVFHNADGSDSKVPMLKFTADYIPSETEYYVEIHYGNSGYEMVIVFPDEGVELEKAMSVDKIVNYEKSLITDPIDLYMPKFDFKYSSPNWVDMLENIGLTPLRDLSGMFADSEGKKIGKILQKVSVTANERGTTAAAATQVGIDCISPGPLKSLTLDRPFGFFIRETSTGAILFMGRVTQL